MHNLSTCFQLNTFLPLANGVFLMKELQQKPQASWFLLDSTGQLHPRLLSAEVALRKGRQAVSPFQTVEVCVERHPHFTRGSSWIKEPGRPTEKTTQTFLEKHIKFQIGRLGQGLLCKVTFKISI